MRIVNLVENELGASGCEAAHGLSFYIETKNHKILFDTSPSDLLLKNAGKLGIDLTKIDSVFLSHGHYDHSGGILPFAKINPDAKIYMQKNAVREYYAFDGEDLGYRYIGIDKKILELPQVVFLEGDVKIDDELQIFCVDNRIRPFPSTNRRLKLFTEGKYIQDEFNHEQNLIVTSENHRLLFSGCSHNGILNILDTMERKFGPDFKPELVIGGFHLMKKTEYSANEISEIEEIANLLKKYKTKFATCHCTGLPAYEMMKKIMKDQLCYVHSGDEIYL
ncbi:MAG: MBL fold metallo-hydrolase [Treponemataceae bacterium]|nr:MBL fold metallo-hydrolase [Treponemataceae bacterium]